MEESYGWAICSKIGKSAHDREVDKLVRQYAGPPALKEFIQAAIPIKRGIQDGGELLFSFEVRPKERVEIVFRNGGREGSFEITGPRGIAQKGKVIFGKEIVDGIPAGFVRYFSMELLVQGEASSTLWWIGLTRPPFIRND